jgi:transcriptional regulator with XRE-family HTH domain
MPKRDGPAKRARIAWKAFGKDVRKVRLNLNVGLRELARLLGMAPATLSRAERGKPVDPATFLFLADWARGDPRRFLAPLYTKEK